MAKLKLFQVCDDIREETNKKMSLMGIYHGNEIFLLRGKTPTSLPRLFFYAIFELKERVNEGMVRIYGPNREDIFKGKTSFPFEVGKRCVLASGVYQFQIPAVGKYRFVLKDSETGKQVFSGTFVISSREQSRSEQPENQRAQVRSKSSRTKRSTTLKSRKK